MTDQDNLIEFLEQFAMERRVEMFDRVLAERTRYLTVVLEDIFQPHNASAVMRSCDGFGIQDIHVIENNNRFRVSRDVALGSDKWLTIHHYSSRSNNTLRAYNHLRKEGYRIVATVPDQESKTLEEFDLEKGKVALVFGTELNGLSEEAIINADESIYIPMFGFTGSFNISVSAAIILHHLVFKLRNSAINWHLSQSEEAGVKLKWLKKSIRNSGLLEKQFLKML